MKDNRERKHMSGAEIRAELIAQDKLDPCAVKVEVFKCGHCGFDFERIVGRGDRNCGCVFRRKAI